VTQTVFPKAIIRMLMYFKRMKKTNTNMPFTTGTDQATGQNLSTESIKKKQTKLTMYGRQN